MNKDATNAVLSEFNYSYDHNGNIIGIATNASNVSYIYDSLNRLIQSENATEKVVYSYDSGSNITAKTYYERATESDAWTEGVTYYYSYNDPVWRDLLTNYSTDSSDSTVFTYDEIGNPLTYRNGKTFTWAGRRLKSHSENEVQTTYTYNQDGIRTSKTIQNGENLVATTYTVLGSTILSETTNGVTRYYLYDGNGEITGFTEGEATYYYVKNLQGDVTSIIDEAGSVLVDYKYNDWGKVTSIAGPSATTLGQANAIRYRSYYYDSVSGFYYLQSRYYDPEVGRFVSIDSQLNDNLQGYNLFAYCNNNPTAMLDRDGHLGVIAGAIIGGVVGGIFGGVKAAIRGESVLAGALTGAAVGVAAGVAAYFLAPVFLGSALAGKGIALATIGTGVVAALADVCMQRKNYNKAKSQSGLDNNSADEITFKDYYNIKSTVITASSTMALVWASAAGGAAITMGIAGATSITSSVSDIVLNTVFASGTAGIQIMIDSVLEGLFE